MAVVLIPHNDAPGAFGNKFKSLLTAIRSGLPYRASHLEGFQELLRPEAVNLANCVMGHRLGCWRFALLNPEAATLGPDWDDPYPEFWDCDWIEFNLRFSKTRKIDGFFQQIPLSIRASLASAVTVIPWNKKMKELFNDIHRQTTGKQIVGVSVRSWRNCHELSNPLAAHRARSYDARAYQRAIVQNQGNCEVFLSFDREDLEQDFQGVQNRFVLDMTGDVWKNATEFQKTAAKCYMLSRCCRTLIGDPRSTFIEAAWVLGGCSANFLSVYQ